MRRIWLAVTADMPQFCAWFGYASGYRRASERLRATQPMKVYAVWRPETHAQYFAWFKHSVAADAYRCLTS
jgi:hypothetical protein